MHTKSIKRRMRTVLPLTLAALLAACSSHSDDKPATGQIARNFSMMGDDGRRYGTVEMDPVGGGKVLDADGRLIGYITPPGHRPPLPDDRY